MAGVSRSGLIFLCSHTVSATVSSAKKTAPASASSLPSAGRDQPAEPAGGRERRRARRRAEAQQRPADVGEHGGEQG